MDSTGAADDTGPAAPPGARWTRRTFLGATTASVGAAAFGLLGCADDGDGDGQGGSSGSSTTAAAAGGTAAVGLRAADVPDEDTIVGWIEEIFEQGVRRPGYPADEWAEEWVAERFREIGLDDVRAEPFTARKWDPQDWSLEIVPAQGEPRTVECFPVPFCTPTDGLELELAPVVEGDPGGVQGRAALVDVALITIPADLLATAGSAPADATGRVIDPEGTFAETPHLIPFGATFLEVMEGAVDAGAAAFIGALRDYPGDSIDYFVPYDAVTRPIPGVWISSSSAAELDGLLAAGPVRVRLTVRAENTEITSHNIVGQLEGADDEVVMIASHHDGPWASAVEDASGMALVLAQATYWAAQPVERRPHGLTFVMQGGHMSGGAGLHAYIEAHRDELADVVLEVHLEHAALEAEERDGEVVAIDRPVPRWFFTSRIPQLEAAVTGALEEEELWRSMVVAPDAFGEQPPTDGAFYHNEGVPIVNFLAAPFYLFDRMDTLDKIDRRALVPLSRATIRIIDSTNGVSAADLRAAVVSPEPAAG